MEKQAYNPFLPLDQYIPDGEPHVFGDRVYLFGSHDQANADTYCTLGYEIFSAPTDDLRNWTSKGINYTADQDPLAGETGRHYLYAPDCVKGNDGRYYLYYALSGEKGTGGYFGPISVAVCDTPDGQYTFYGHVRNANGMPFSDHVLFDPAVINDDGVIRLYYGTYYPFSSLPKIFRPVMRRIESRLFGRTPGNIRSSGDDIMGPCMVVLEDDMLTVKSPAVRILPVHDRHSAFRTDIHVIPRAGHYLSGHGFFEGSSIRKINGRYYFIYSSMNNHELCYACSRYPDRAFTYGGVIISNGDVGYLGRTENERLNYTATNHGSIEQINGKWYVFYHRQTHGNDYSRQACAEEIEILPDGSIPQVELTSCGLNGADLKGSGTYPAAICSSLTNGHMPHGNNSRHKNIPMIFSDAGQIFIRDMTKHTSAGYKYFDLSETRKIFISARGNGVITVLVNHEPVSECTVCSRDWKEYACNLSGTQHAVLEFCVQTGKVELLEFRLAGDQSV